MSLPSLRAGRRSVTATTCLTAALRASSRARTCRATQQLRFATSQSARAAFMRCTAISRRHSEQPCPAPCFTSHTLVRPITRARRFVRIVNGQVLGRRAASSINPPQLTPPLRPHLKQPQHQSFRYSSRAHSSSNRFAKLQVRTQTPTARPARPCALRDARRPVPLPLNWPAVAVC